MAKAAASVEPPDGSLDNPAFGQHHKLPSIGALDDLHVDLTAGTLQSLLELRPLIAAVGVEFQQEREHAEQRAHEQNAAVPILDVGGMDDRVQQQALRIYQDMALLAFDLLSRIVARQVA